MTAPYTLFEVSWEVCNKVGGIHTVVSTKARTLVSELGDDYVAIGPWLLGSSSPGSAFEEAAGYEDFCESCRAMGIPVRVGRWKIPGRPLTILVEFSGLYGKKDAILAQLWEDWKVDSLLGEWDYVEPVLFGWAVGQVIEKWWQERLAPERRASVAQFHEWMTASGSLYLKKRVPAVGTIFTTHATMLGRAISSTGKLPSDGVGTRKVEDVAREHGVVAKNSMEGTCAREADVFTTVSELTAVEAQLLFGRRAQPVLPNGIELDVIDELAGQTTRAEAEHTLRTLAARFLGEDRPDAALLAISGRYEFHNKGIDFLLEALARMNQSDGRPIILFVLVPAGNSGVRAELHERLMSPAREGEGAIGISTHNLFDFERDPVHQACKQLGFANALGSRVKIIQVPVYLAPGDGIFDLPYEAVLRAMELSVFPSFYEPWGYTPEESLAVGVPTVTTDLAGFGVWARSRGLTGADGVHVISRERVSDDAALPVLVEYLERFLSETRDRDEMARICRKTAQLTAWSDLIKRYHAAFESAVANALQRAAIAPTPSFRPRLPLPVAPGARPRLTRFNVAATLPRELHGLERLSRNFWWSWDPEAVELFRELSPKAWEASRHNPVVFLRDMRPDNLREKAADKKYVARLAKVTERFDAYMASAPGTCSPAPHIGKGTEPSTEKSTEKSTAKSTARKQTDPSRASREHPVAYFCAEFGVHESLRIYSGGLGLLAGDHLKSASDLDLPMVAVGLFYRAGYLRQKLTSSGEQIAGEIVNDPRELPLEAVLDADGEPLEIVLQMPSSELVLRAWKAMVGRVPLYLLDSDVPANRPEDRGITRSLYGGDHENRLRQEIVLGRGGRRLLMKLHVLPSCFHINEGHAAFLVLERVSSLVRDVGLTFDEAREFVRATTVFTTHTPVPAGHDRFGEDLMRRYFSDAPAWVGVPWERFFQLGTCEDDRGSFNMTYLAMSFAAFVNGVSELHGHESRKLLHPFWPRLLESEVPVTSITNGVHLPTWTHPELRKLLGVTDRAIVGDDFARAKDLDPKALWKHKLEAKRRLLDHVRERLDEGFRVRGDSPRLKERMQAGLDPDALWIGFARRFAPYKRANLLFRDPERLEELVSSSTAPVRFVFAGKAHPADKHGQELLKQIVELTRSDAFAGKIFFVEDYDIDLARYLVQGVDVWLNNPIRPLEASGTSGMKVAANGGLNLSILDGWWCEGFDPNGSNGWSIGAGAEYASQELQDEADSESLYRLLREEVVPLYHERVGGIARGWLERARASLTSLAPVFNTDRMVTEYAERAYAPLSANWFAMRADRFARTRSVSVHATNVRKAFDNVKIRAAHMADLSGLRDGDQVGVRVEVAMAGLTSEELTVELVLGHMHDNGSLQNRTVVVLEPDGPPRNDVVTFEGTHAMTRSGAFAYGIRVRARHHDDLELSTRDLVSWA